MNMKAYKGNNYSETDTLYGGPPSWLSICKQQCILKKKKKKKQGTN